MAFNAKLNELLLMSSAVVENTDVVAITRSTQAQMYTQLWQEGKEVARRACTNRQVTDIASQMLRDVQQEVNRLLEGGNPKSQKKKEASTRKRKKRKESTRELADSFVSS